MPDNTADTTFLDVCYNGEYPFVVTKTGHLIATDANIKGTITAINGSIGGWNINNTYIQSSSGIGASSTVWSITYWSDDYSVKHMNQLFTGTLKTKMKSTGFYYVIGSNEFELTHVITIEPTPFEQL